MEAEICSAKPPSLEAIKLQPFQFFFSYAKEHLQFFL